MRKTCQMTSAKNCIFKNEDILFTIFFSLLGYVSSQTSQKAVLRSEKLSEIKAPLPAKPSSKNSAKEDIHESTRVSPTLPPESQKKQKQQHCSGLVVTDCKYFPVPTEFDKKKSE